jgi:hypothetical protein
VTIPRDFQTTFMLSRHIRTSMQSQTGLSASLAYEIAELAMRRRFPQKDGHPCGTFVDDFGVSHPITAPVRQTTPLTNLRPVSITSLVVADGVVDDADVSEVEDEVSEDDPSELSVEAMVRAVDAMVISDDTSDEEVLRDDSQNGEESSHGK